MGIRCGIDLGTTFSAITYFDSYNNRIEKIDLEHADGGNIMHSMVYYPGNGQEPVVGSTAYNTIGQYPEKVIKGIKRSMGMDYKTSPIEGKEYSPQEVSSEILKAITEDANIYLGEPVKSVVITVPAYFGDRERAATEEAAKLADLDVICLLPEPHAAALAYSIQKATDINDRYLLIYDLGGGTFDVTLIHATTSTDSNSPLDLNIETLCKDGNASLGGLDWDKILMEIVADKVMQSFGDDVRQDPKNEAILIENCEKAKRILSRAPDVNIIADLKGTQVQVTLSEFEDNSSNLLIQTQDLLEVVLEKAEKEKQISKDQIDVLLVGGSTRMPMIPRMIESVMGKPPLRYSNPELLVSMGAAYWAHLNQKESKITVPIKDLDGGIEEKELVVSDGGLTDISFYSVGIEAMKPDGQGGWQKQISVIIPEGSSYAEEFGKDFQTTQDDMPEIRIKLYKADSTIIEECEYLATFTIIVPPGLKKGTGVNIKLGYDESGIIRGKATVATGEQVDITYDRTNQ